MAWEGVWALNGVGGQWALNGVGGRVGAEWRGRACGHGVSRGGAQRARAKSDCRAATRTACRGRTRPERGRPRHVQVPRGRHRHVACASAAPSRRP
jgi:hypothetical protein